MSQLWNRLLRAGLLPLALLLVNASDGAERVIRAENMTLAPGETNRLYITLDSGGDENALGFSVCFDPSLLTFISARRGAATLSAPQYIPNTNLNQSAAGRVGVLIGLAPPQTFPAGSNGIWEIVFRAAAGAGSVETYVSFCDTPVGRGVVDGSDEVNELPVSYVDATVFIQGACSYSLNTNAASFPAAGGSGFVNVTADAACAWTVENTNSWITISPTNGTESGVVSYTVAANTDLSARIGVMTIAGKTFTVNQAGFACAYSISATTRNHGPGATTNSVDLATSGLCAWTVASGSEWIAVLSAVGGTGSTSVEYSVAANPNLVGRTGSVMIADQLLTIIQEPFECAYQLLPTGGTPGPGASSNSFEVITGAVCDWIATTANNWITLVAGTNGTGGSTVGYLIAANPDGAPRSGAIFVGDQIFAITQSGVACEAGLTPANRSHGFGSESGVVSVAIPGGCPWQVVITNAWITIDFAVNGMVGYTVASNTAFVTRSSVLTIAGVNFVVTQAGAPCVVSLLPASASHGTGMETGLVSVAIGAGCGWTANNTNNWITILSGASGSGDGTVAYAVASNLNLTPRSGTLWIDGTPFVVNQAAYVCSYELSLTNVTHDFTANTNVVSVTADPICEWSAVTTNDWISIAAGASRIGSGDFTYSLLPNPGTTARTGVVMAAGQVLTIMQQASTGGFAFEAPTMSPSGDVTLKLNGGPPGIWEIQTSSNLVTWVRLTDVTNTAGKVELIAPATGSEKRFYRAVRP